MTKEGIFMTKEGSRTLSATLTQASWVLIVQGEEITHLLFIYFSSGSDRIVIKYHRVLIRY